MRKPKINPLDDLLGYRMRRVSTQIMAELARNLAEIDFRPAEATVLLLIGTNPGITQSQIGRLLNIQRANMAPMTAGLERRGLIARQRASGRSHGLVVTDAGTVAHERIRATMQAHDAQFFGALSATDRQGLARILGELREGAERA